MPVAGVSTVLENMVTSVMQTHFLKTWNLFHEENGNITFRLKFEHIQELPMELHTDISRSENHRTISFKKKNEKQITRDKARSRKRRKVRQSVSSIESNRDHQTETQSDIISNSGLQFEAIDEDILESTPLYTLNSPVVEEPSSIESGPELDVISTADGRSDERIELPPTPEFIINDELDNQSVGRDEGESSANVSMDDVNDEQCGISEEAGNRLCAKLDELIKKFDTPVKTKFTLSSDSDSDT